MCKQSAFGGMLRDIVELDSIVLRPGPSIRKSSGAVSKRGNKLPVQSAAKPPSSPGTAVPGSGAATAAIPLRTPATRPSKAALSHPVRSFWSLSSTRTLSSASTRSPSCSIPSTILSTRHCEREKPPLSAASPSSGNVSSTPSTALPRSMKPATNVRATRDRRRRGTASLAAAPVIVADHAGKEHPVIR